MELDHRSYLGLPARLKTVLTVPICPLLHASPAYHVEGVAFSNCGQADAIGRYPVHWHMAGQVGAACVGPPAAGGEGRGGKAWAQPPASHCFGWGKPTHMAAVSRELTRPAKPAGWGAGQRSRTYPRRPCQNAPPPHNAPAGPTAPRPLLKPVNTGRCPPGPMRGQMPWSTQTSGPTPSTAPRACCWRGTWPSTWRGTPTFLRTVGGRPGRARGTGF